MQWFDEHPEWLEWELAQLEAEAWSFHMIEKALQDGRIVLEGTVQSDGGLRHLAIVFPFTYPEHRVEIYDLNDDAPLPLHQNPYQRNLCLLDNSPKAWTPADSAAGMVKRVLELRKAALEGEEGLRRIGVGAPEPGSTYYPYAPNSSVLVHEDLLNVAGERGWFHFRPQAGTNLLQGIISEVHTKVPVNASLQAPRDLSELFQGPPVRGAWFRLATAPPWLKGAREFFDWALSSIPDFRKLWAEAKALRFFDNVSTWMFAFIYPDDGPDGNHDAWLACQIHLKRQGNTKVPVRGELLRPFILSREDQERRIPTLGPLRGKRVAVMGLGTVGAPVALELARTGLLSEILLVDHDHLSIWNLVRHPLTLTDLGADKVWAIARLARLSAPSLKTTGMKLRIGEPYPPNGSFNQAPEVELLSQLQQFDLIIDATADDGVSRFLNRFSLRAGIPMIVASVTEGGWGGEVIRSIPCETGCYECYLWHDRDGAFTSPNQDPEAKPVYTRGCGFPTFTGTGFDALSTAADATRMAVQTLLRREPDAYPDAAHDILIRHNRGTPSGNAGFPRYDAHDLPVHPKCGWHNRGDG